MAKFTWKWLFVFALIAVAPVFAAGDDDDEAPQVQKDLRSETVGLKTDDGVVEREEMAIDPDGYSVAEQKLIREQAETHHFQAEVNKLMNIIINSLYSNREIFLREIISNASDALDKIRFLSLTDASLLGEGDQALLEIRIRFDKEAKTLHITDRGIGMTKDELVKNLGTIAQSGTKEFLQRFAEAGDKTSNLIGQFGVGFYSVFLVADEVVVTSKANGDDQYVWTSTADSSFTIAKDPKGNTLGRGTRVSLHLKDDALEYLSQDTLRSVAKKYSEFINYPIYLYSSSEVEEEVPSEEEAKDEDKAEDEIKVEDEEEDEDEDEEEAPKKTIKKTVWNWERLNETRPIWTRSAKDITDEEYNNFYKAISKDNEDPILKTHFTAEGDAEFKSILYIPATAPQNLFDNDPRNFKGLKLYVRRVFITDDFSEIVPSYLRFLRGVVDSDDLPLNVSREILQQSKVLDQIKKKLVRKAIAMIQELYNSSRKDDVEEPAEGEQPVEETEEQKEKREEALKKYHDFWKNYGTSIKYGMIEDAGNRSRLVKLCLWHSTKVDELSTFDDYVSRMKEGQEGIYYLAGQSKDVLQKSPLIERLIKKGYEVLLMVDPIDEYSLQSVTKYDGKHKLINVGKDPVNIEDDSEEDKEKVAEEFKGLQDYIKTQLPDKVDKVILSNRLTESPMAIVANTYGYTANMERILKAQALSSTKEFHSPKKTVEINPNHPIIKDLNRKVTENPDDESAKITTKVLFETSLLTSGYIVEDPNDFATWIHRMMTGNLNTASETTATTTSTIKDEL